MDKKILESYINSGLSLNKIVNKTGKSLTTIRYWAKKYNLKSQHKTIKNKAKEEYGKFRLCPYCGKEVPTKDFYSRRGKPNSSVYCKVCTNEQVIKRQRQTKIKMINNKKDFLSFNHQILIYNKII